MRTADSPLNLQAIALEEAEAKIRETVKNEYFAQSSASAIGRKVDKIIVVALKNITITVLKNAAFKSLRDFAQRQLAELRSSFNSRIFVLLALMKLTDKTVSAAIKVKARQTLVSHGYDSANLYGTPLKLFSEDYIKKYVKPALDRLAEQYTFDPDDIRSDRQRRNSLRNRAEMEVRYQGHFDNIEALKAAGCKLVIASTHADCSDRCSKWQGKVYSLDKSYGATDDGRKYEPLENATDVYYTTKAGKVYKNGLLGFNCRHYLIPYRSGYRYPNPNPNEEAKQYVITKKQRELERRVQEWRTRAIEYKGTDRKSYLEARKKAIEWNNAYIKYSQDHRRAYYPSRTKLI